MKKRLYLGFTILAMVAVILGMLIWQRSGRNYYRGRSLKDWSNLAYHNDPKAKAALKAAGSNAVPALIELLQTKDSAIRKRTWSYFPSLPQKWKPVVWKKVGPPLAVSTREAAAISLGIIGRDARAAIPALTQALHDREGTVSWDAAIALGCIGTDSVPSLITALQDQEITIRHAAATTLGQVGQGAEPSIPALLRSLGDTNQTIRSSTADSLWRLGVPGQLALIEASAHADGLARDAAKVGLDRLNASGINVTITVAKLTHDGSPVIRRRAVESLGFLNAGSPLPRKALLAALNDPVTEVRLAAINVLAERGQRAQFAVAGLTSLSQDPDASVRAAAEKALARVSNSPPGSAEKPVSVLPQPVD